MNKKDFNEMFQDYIDKNKIKGDDILNSCSEEKNRLKCKKILEAQRAKNERSEIILKLNMMMGLKSLHGILFIEALLEKLKLVK